MNMPPVTTRPLTATEAAHAGVARNSMIVCLDAAGAKPRPWQVMLAGEWNGPGPRPWHWVDTLTLPYLNVATAAAIVAADTAYRQTPEGRAYYEKAFPQAA